MNKFKQIIRWPANEVNNRAPWYQVGWRMLWVIPAASALLLYCVLAGVMYGYEYGVAAWRENQ